MAAIDGSINSRIICYLKSIYEGTRSGRRLAHWGLGQSGSFVTAARIQLAAGRVSVEKIARVLVVVGIAVALSSFAAGQGYTFNLVRVPNSNPNVPTAMNNAGQVVVNSGTASALSVSLWNRMGGVESLELTGTNNVGAALDDANDVVGAGDPDGSGKVQAFLWQPGGNTTYLGTLGGVLSAASGVNTAREVVGTAFTAAGLQHAFLWTEASGMQDLTPNLTSFGATAMGINTAGEVVGYYYPNGASNVVGFSWTQASGLQSFGAPGTMAFAVNDAGTIVGQELTAGGYRHAFSKTQSGGLADLGTLGGNMSTALNINNNGWIVGTSTVNDAKNLLHGFLWTPSGGMQDLVALSAIGSGSQPYSMQVNDYGDIALTTRSQLVILVPRITATAVGSPNPSVVGQSVTVTATLTSIAGPPPDGEALQLFLNSTQVGLGTLKNGVAECVISGLKAGTHTVALVYNGDNYYLPFRYTPLQLVVNPAANKK